MESYLSIQGQKTAHSGWDESDRVLTNTGCRKASRATVYSFTGCALQQMSTRWEEGFAQRNAILYFPQKCCIE